MRELVEKLVAITLPDLEREACDTAAEHDEFAESLREKFRRQQIELRMKHFEPGQVQALLDFYDSEMGASILESQAKIDRELARSVSILTDE